MPDPHDAYATEAHRHDFLRWRNGSAPALSHSPRVKAHTGADIGHSHAFSHLERGDDEIRPLFSPSRALQSLGAVLARDFRNFM
jgi:hypothetical protein